MGLAVCVYVTFLFVKRTHDTGIIKNVGQRYLFKNAIVHDGNFQ